MCDWMPKMSYRDGLVLAQNKEFILMNIVVDVKIEFSDIWAAD